MNLAAVTPAHGNPRLLERLKSRGLDVLACYQCGKCSAGCPISPHLDLLPMEVVRLSAYGMEEPLGASHAIWLCASCETCTTRCPNGIDVAGLMDALREWTLERGTLPAELRVPLFHDAFLRSVRRWGRAFELGMLGAYKLRSGDYFGDLGLGAALFKRGKIRLWPDRIADRRKVRALFRASGKGKAR